MVRFNITPIRAFRDNYIWALRGSDVPQVAIVDPGDATPVIAALEAERRVLSAILVTHHHGDHVGGIAALVEQYPGVPVFGPRHESIPGLTCRLGEGDQVNVPGIDVTFSVLDVPGHTRGHIAFYGHGALFCGDTLFSVGCGRLFEGSSEQMHASLQKISRLPPGTLIYCAHEYTLDNIGFAKWVEPENVELRQREEQAFIQTDLGLPTVPSTLAQELNTNPFLRSHMPAVIAAAKRYVGHELMHGHEVFGAIRQWKDRQYD